MPSKKDRFEARVITASERKRPYRNVRIAAGVLWQPLFVPSRGAVGHKFTVPLAHPLSLPHRTNAKSGFEGRFSLPKGIPMLQRSMFTKRRSRKPDPCAHPREAQSGRESRSPYIRTLSTAQKWPDLRLGAFSASGSEYKAIWRPKLSTKGLDRRAIPRWVPARRIAGPSRAATQNLAHRSALPASSTPLGPQNGTPKRIGPERMSVLITDRVYRPRSPP
jgi:hypothetical protein